MPSETNTSDKILCRNSVTDESDKERHVHQEAKQKSPTSDIFDTKKWRFCPMQFAFLAKDEACIWASGGDKKFFWKPPRHRTPEYWAAVDKRKEELIKNSDEKKKRVWGDEILEDVKKATMAKMEAWERLKKNVHAWLEDTIEEKRNFEIKRISWADETVESGLEVVKRNLREGIPQCKTFGTQVVSL